MYKYFFKRVFDFFLALILLLFFSPLFLIVAVLIKLTSSGPIFFSQNRGGKGGQYFSILKFRSMTVKSEADGKDFHPGSDDRVTSIGQLLRKTKMDELPQLINVLKGEMSMVGPRPEVKVYIDLYPERWKKVLSIRPGITDPASISFRNEEELLAKADDAEMEYRQKILPYKLNLYEQYVEKVSLFTDIKLLVLTIFVVLKA